MTMFQVNNNSQILMRSWGGSGHDICYQRNISQQESYQSRIPAPLSLSASPLAFSSLSRHFGALAQEGFPAEARQPGSNRNGQWEVAAERHQQMEGELEKRRRTLAEGDRMTQSPKDVAGKEVRTRKKIAPMVWLNSK